MNSNLWLLSVFGFFAGVLITYVIAYIISLNRRNEYIQALQKADNENEQIKVKNQEQQQLISQLNSDISSQRDKLEKFAQNYAKLQSILSVSETREQHLQNDNKILQNHLSELEKKYEQQTNLHQTIQHEKMKAEEQLKHLNKRLEESKSFLDNATKLLSDRFHHLADDILKQRSQEFSEKNSQQNKLLSEQNQTSIKNLIEPVHKEIEKFNHLIQETNEKNAARNATLQAELEQLKNLNTNLSIEANNLTRALQMNNKIQGNWGEVILEKILENAGLLKNQHYILQHQIKDDEKQEKTKIPDVIIRLPENRSLVIDAKVSLNSYLDYIQAQNNQDIQQIQNTEKSLNNSLESHIKNLSSKDYSHWVDGNSPDFVFMFIPIEPVFQFLCNQEKLLYTAYKHNVIPVSPNSLYAMLRTVESIWRVEDQTKNVQEITKVGGDLYDKFTNFLEEFDKIGNGINKIQELYENAERKLKGKGNLCKQADKLQRLGVSVKKQMPEHYLTDEIDGDILQFEEIED